MTRRTALALAALLATGDAFAHGASKGLHIHLDPATAAPGAQVKISVDAALPMERLTIGWVGSDPAVVVPKQPLKHLETTLTVPASAAKATNAQAEAIVTGGKTFRASAILSVLP